MWRRIFAVILLPTITAVQTVAQDGAAQSNDKPATKAAAGKRPAYESFTYYNQIRRGTTEDAVVVLEATGWASTPDHPVTDIVPVKLEFEPAPGLTVRSLRFPTPMKHQFDSSPKPVAVTNASYLPIRFKIRADANAPLGPLSLKGRLTFQTIDYKAVVTPEKQIDVEIRLVVVEHGAKVNEAAQWPVSKTPVALIVVLLVFSPVLVPLGLIVMGVCGLSTGDVGCE